MKKLFKVAAGLMAAVLITGSLPVGLTETEFAHIGSGIVNAAENGAWVHSGNNWYYSVNGNNVRGWQKINNVWYYFWSDGRMATGWVYDAGINYYMASSGAMVTGWKFIDNEWYYFGSSGKLVTDGWKFIDDEWYFFRDYGTMARGWQNIDNIWYYFTGSGVMARGWKKLGDVWYYFKGSGEMVTGWRLIGGKYYYFYNSGAMAHDTNIEGRYLTSSGAWDGNGQTPSQSPTPTSVPTATATPTPTATPAPLQTVTADCSDANCHVEISDSDGDGEYDNLRFYGSGSISQGSNPVGYSIYKNSIRTIVIEEGITNISSMAFYNFSKITEITIPSTVTNVSYSAFGNCTSLKNVTALGSITNGKSFSEFIGCTSLESIVVTCDSESNIKNRVGTGLANLVSVSHNGSNSRCAVCNNASAVEQCGGQSYFYILDDDGDGIAETAHIRGTGSLYSNYSETNPSDFTKHASEITRVVFEFAPTSIPQYTFTGLVNLTEITVPSGVTTIGTGAFKNCNSLTDVVIAGTVCSIGTSSFENCSSLVNISFEESDTTVSINNDAFKNCTSLTEFIAPKLNTYLASTYFANCTSLRRIVMTSNRHVAANYVDDWSLIEEFVADCNVATKYLQNYMDADKIVRVHNQSDRNCVECYPPIPQGPDATEYTYEVFPFFENFNRYVFVRTNNPDPTSFCLIDSDSSLRADPVNIVPTTIRFLDIDYENYETGRFNGGYICTASGSDGGVLTVGQYNQVAPYTSNKYQFLPTDKTVTAGELTDLYGIIWTHCVDANATFWDNMSSIQAYLDEWALYPLILTEEAEDTYMYYQYSQYQEVGLELMVPWGEISSDKVFAIENYPFVLDSSSMPAVMRNLARRLAPDVVIESTYLHYMNNYTLDGQSGWYGGAGMAGTVSSAYRAGKDSFYSRHVDQIFSNTSEITMTRLKDVISGYWDSAIAENVEQNEVCIQSYITDRLGANGGWLRIFGNRYLGYTPRHPGISNAWFDGRYLGSRGYEPGATFADHPTAQIILTNITYTDYRGRTVTSDVAYKYDKTHDAWVGVSSYGYVSNNSYYTYSYDVILANSPNLVLSRTQVEALRVDRNTNTVPQHGLIYDGTVYPGTPF